MDPLSQLTELLKRMPGIGPRQSRRLAFWFVRQDLGFIQSFSKALVEARSTITVCPGCKRLHPKSSTRELCAICSSEARDASTIMLVEKDVDLENIERTGTYAGRYFVLGGTTSPLDTHPEKKVRIEGFLSLLANTEVPITEVIIALSATTEGEDTYTYIEEKIKPIVTERNITITKLGRGLSTGTELEYVDKDTMDHALKGRM